MGDIAPRGGVAGRLGMTVQLSVASSWDMGGAWVEPRHASMGLYDSEVEIEGPAALDRVLPMPPVPAGARRRARPAGVRAGGRRARRSRRPTLSPGFDFVFALDPPGVHTLRHAVLTNTPGEGTKEFSIAVSTTEPTDAAFREVLRGAPAPHAEPQRLELPAVPARYAQAADPERSKTRGPSEFSSASSSCSTTMA